mgnify:CR=1 FL=1
MNPKEEVEQSDSKIEEAMADKIKISESDALKKYDEFLNDLYGEVKICGYLYESAWALKKVDEKNISQKLIKE